MKKRKQKDLVVEFVEGRAFAKVSGKKGFNSFIKDVVARYPEIMLDIPQNMIDDFGVNNLSEEYHLVYFHKARKIKCAGKEFFDYVYKTEWTFQPEYDGRNKIFWFEI
jgi:hypothetical protein